MAAGISLAELLAEADGLPATTPDLIGTLKHNMSKPRYGWQVVLHQSTAASILARLEKLEAVEKLLREGA